MCLGVLRTSEGQLLSLNSLLPLWGRGGGNQTQVVRLVWQSFLSGFVGNIQVNMKTSTLQILPSENISRTSNFLVGRFLYCDLHATAFFMGVTMLLFLSPFLLDLQL